MRTSVARRHGRREAVRHGSCSTPMARIQRPFPCSGARHSLQRRRYPYRLRFLSEPGHGCSGQISPGRVRLKGELGKVSELLRSRSVSVADPPRTTECESKREKVVSAQQTQPAECDRSGFPYSHAKEQRSSSVSPATALPPEFARSVQDGGGREKACTPFPTAQQRPSVPEKRPK